MLNVQEIVLPLDQAWFRGRLLGTPWRRRGHHRLLGGKNVGQTGINWLGGERQRVFALFD